MPWEVQANLGIPPFAPPKAAVADLALPRPGKPEFGWHGPI